MRCPRPTVKRPLIARTPTSSTESIGARAKAEGSTIHIISEGNDGDARRFDRWELAAARAAAIGRAIRAGGMDEQGIDIAIPSTASHNKENGQMVRVIRVPAA